MLQRWSGALVLCFLTLLFGSIPAVAVAQLSEDSHWGVSASVTPTWKSHERLLELLFGLDGEGEIEGSEFTVGLVRGSMRGGEWGVSFVRKPFKNGGTLVEGGEPDCFENFCSSHTSTKVMQDVALRGIEFHSFIPFVTIADRVQIGVNVGGGIGFPEGTIIETEQSTFSDPLFGSDTNTDTFVSPANEVMYKYVPLAKAEVQGAIIVAPGLKIKISGGLNLPSSTSFRIGVVYLIGAN